MAQHQPLQLVWEHVACENMPKTINLRDASLSFIIIKLCCSKRKPFHWSILILASAGRESFAIFYSNLCSTQLYSLMKLQEFHGYIFKTRVKCQTPLKSSHFHNYTRAHLLCSHRDIKLIPYSQGATALGSSTCFDFANFYIVCPPKEYVSAPRIKPRIFYLLGECVNSYIIELSW